MHTYQPKPRRIGFQKDFTEKGEIYYKLVRVLYERYCDRKEKLTFDETEFVEFLKAAGTIAWEMLKNGKGWVRRSEVIKAVGEGAFHYGLFTGSGSYGFSKPDAPITFFHETVKDFLGAFHFIQMLEDGYSVGSLLETDLEGDILLNNTFFFQFCLWLLSDSCRKEYIEFRQREKIYDTLVSLVAHRVTIVQMDMGDLVPIFPILRIPFINNEENAATLKFISKILLKCDKAQELHFGSFSFYPTDVLCELLQLFPPHLSASEEQEAEKTFVMLESATNHLAMGKILNHCEHVGIRPTLLLQNGLQTDLSDCIHPALGKLALYDVQHVSTLSVQRAVTHCQFLTELHIVNIRVGGRVLGALAKAVKKGKLPYLSLLSFTGCSHSLKGKLFRLFIFKWPKLSFLKLDKCYLDTTDIKTLTMFVCS